MSIEFNKHTIISGTMDLHSTIVSDVVLCACRANALPACPELDAQATLSPSKPSLSPDDIALELHQSTSDQIMEASLHEGRQPKPSAALMPNSSLHNQQRQLGSSSVQPQQSVMKLNFRLDAVQASESHVDGSRDNIRHVMFASQQQAMSAVSAASEAKAHNSVNADDQAFTLTAESAELILAESEASAAESKQAMHCGQGILRLPSTEVPQALGSSPDEAAQTIKASQLVRRRLPKLRMPPTRMGTKHRAANRAGTPRFVAEGTESAFSFSNSAFGVSMNSARPESLIMLEACVQSQPTLEEEEQAALALHHYLSLAGSDSSSAAVPGSRAESADMYSLSQSSAQHAQHSSRSLGLRQHGPIAEGTESIAAFHPSWHLRAAHSTRQSQEQPRQSDDTSLSDDDNNPLDQFFRPAGGSSKSPARGFSQNPQHQPSMVEQAGCLNFSSHVVSDAQLPQKAGQGFQKPRAKPRNPIDDVVLSSEEASEVDSQDAEHDSATEFEPRATQHAQHLSADPADDRAQGVFADSEQEQEPAQFDEGQYADYHSEEGQSDDPGLDESSAYLPAGIADASEVYSPMSHGATRVRSMITQRPFMLEEPVSPAAERLGLAQVTFSTQSLGDTVVMQAPGQPDEPLYRDWSQSAQSFSANAQETAAAAASEADLAAEAEQEEVGYERVPLSDPNITKAPSKGAISKLTGTLFRRSGKRTAETQTTEQREEETQTLDQPESEANLQQLVPAGQPELGQELSFGDALKAQPALAFTAASEPAQRPEGAGMMLSDLIESHGPLAMTAMSSPTHTSAFVLPAEQTSPAQLAGLAEAGDTGLNAQVSGQQVSTAVPQQLLGMPDVSCAADMMTFQVDGQIKLGLRPRQLTFSASAQPPPQLTDGQTAGSASGALSQLSPDLTLESADGPVSFSGQGPSPVPLLQPAGGASGAVSNMAAPSEQQPLPMAAASVSRQASMQADQGPADLPAGQPLTAVAPSLSWPGKNLASGLPTGETTLSRQPSALASKPSRQGSAALQAPSRQGSAALPGPFKQPSGTVSNASRQASAVARLLSKQPSAAAQMAPYDLPGLPQQQSRQNSAVASDMPLSRQLPAAVQDKASTEPDQAAGNSPQRGIEQAWAALLPTLLAEVNRQQHDSAAASGPAASDLASEDLQQASSGSDAAQTVMDILKTWAPVPKSMSTGNSQHAVMSSQGFQDTILCFKSHVHSNGQHDCMLSIEGFEESAQNPKAMFTVTASMPAWYPFV